MGEDEWHEWVDMGVHERLSPTHPLDQYRNERAIESALLRGDDEIILTNTRTLAGLKEPRYLHPSDTHQSNPYEIEYKIVGSPDNEGGLTEDEIRERLDKRWKGFRLEFLKILGTGGLGAGTLWRVHFEGGVTKQVVIKVPKNADAYSEDEMGWHQRYKGSRHTVQFVDLAEMASDARDTYKANHPGMPCQYDRGWNFISDDQTGMPLEFMSRGDLFRILRKASVMKLARFPDKALWGIWECLVKGAAAMAYQPRANKWNVFFENEMEKAEANGNLEAFFKSLETDIITHDIHLDLEESNILAGEDSEHPEQPVFKIHDFGGFSFAMDEAWGHVEENFYWRRRRPAKMTRLTPEQVHQGWDTLRSNLPGRDAVERFEGPDLTKGNPIAGRYGVWTTIFILAKTMEAVVTLLYIAHPFTSEDYVTLDGKKRGRTYGWRLNRPEYERVDPELRDILCACLFERPIDRPSIIDLLRGIEARKQRGFPERPGDLKWFWDMILSPSAPTPAPASAAPDAGLDLEEVIQTNVMSSAEREARLWGDELDMEGIARANIMSSGEEGQRPRFPITVTDESMQSTRLATSGPRQTDSSSRPRQGHRFPITVTDESGQGSRLATQEPSLLDFEDSDESAQTNVMTSSEQRARLAGPQSQPQVPQAHQDSDKENRRNTRPSHCPPLWMEALMAAADQPDPHLSQDRIAQSQQWAPDPISQQPAQEPARVSQSPPPRESLRGILSYIETETELDATNALRMRHVSPSSVSTSSQGSTAEETGSDESSDFERPVKRPRVDLEAGVSTKKRAKLQDEDAHLSTLCRQLSMDSELTSPPGSPRHANMARFRSTSRVKKVPSPKAKPHVKKSMPQSEPRPTAIQNLLVRSQQLEKRLGYKTVDQVSKASWEN